MQIRLKNQLLRATTDSDGTIRFDMENKPGISNLLNIYSAFSGMKVPDIEKKYEGCGYGDFKKDLVEVTVDAIMPIQQRFKEIRESEELINILKDGAEKANAISERTVNRVKNKFGLGL